MDLDCPSKWRYKWQNDTKKVSHRNGGSLFSDFVIDPVMIWSILIQVGREMIFTTRSREVEETVRKTGTSPHWSNAHMRTTVLVYLPTILGDYWDKFWDSYTSTMVHIWDVKN